MVEEVWLTREHVKLYRGSAEDQISKINSKFYAILSIMIDLRLRVWRKD